MNSLRLIFILIGLLVLALIILFHRPEGETRRNHARWRAGRREPVLGDDPVSSDDFESHQADELAPPQAPQVEAPEASEAPEAGSPVRMKGERPAQYGSPDKIVSLYIRRRNQQKISGSELLDAAIKAGLDFGEMNIFHRRQEGEKQPIFSMANLTAPGHFDPSQWNVFSTPGVTLFLVLPAPVSALDAWDAMLATGERIGRLLSADVLDDAECLLSRQRIAQVRESMREYDRKSDLLKLQ